MIAYRWSLIKIFACSQKFVFVGYFYILIMKNCSILISEKSPAIHTLFPWPRFLTKNLCHVLMRCQILYQKYSLIFLLNVNHFFLNCRTRTFTLISNLVFNRLYCYIDKCSSNGEFCFSGPYVSIYVVTEIPAVYLNHFMFHSFCFLPLSLNSRQPF